MFNIRGVLSRNKLWLLYGFSLAALLILLRMLEWHFVVMQHSMELYIGAVAILFTGLGIWLALKLAKPKIETVVVEKIREVERITEIEKIVEVEKIVEIEVEKKEVNNVPFRPDEKELNILGISKRELEVLQLMSAGLSNQEIAERLFVSL